jgi:hypothetical protein
MKAHSEAQTVAILKFDLIIFYELYASWQLWYDPHRRSSLLLMSASYIILCSTY